LKSPKEKKKSSGSRKTSAKKRTPVEPIKAGMEGGPEASANGVTQAASETSEILHPPVAKDPAPMAANANGFDRVADSDTKPAEAVELPREVIAARAYELYLERGCVHGHHLEDWLLAERELRIKHS
jgi:Protein of unknown function (DUF2934)